jgi:predicted site-specific integrase-resolvase
MSGEEELVTATVISREFSIPVATVYRMASKGRIPFVDATKDYHERKRYLFNREEVRKALGRTRPQPPAPED